MYLCVYFESYEEELKEALEKTTVEDIQKWTDKNIGMTLLKKRRE